MAQTNQLTNQLTNQPTNQPTSSPKKRTGCIVAAVVTLLLTMCLCGSLAGNAGLGGWVLWVNYQLRREQTRAQALESEVRRLQGLLSEEGVEIPLAPADAALIDATEGQVATLRGLEPMQPVERALMGREQLYERIFQDFEDEFSPEEARDYALTLAAFDMLDPELDLYDLLLDLYTEQIAGFYDVETEQIYVISDVGIMGQMERLHYAHEFTHALQDQHFDLEALGIRDDADEEYDSEYLSAIRALIEGDASLSEQLFLASHYTPAEIATLMEEITGVDTSVLDSVPDALKTQLLFPYESGLLFVQALYKDGGWAAVDAAYADPPRSTEHILHVDRYRAGDEPQLVSLPPLTDTLGTGWRQVDEDIVGEFFTRYYLAQQIPAEEAENAAEGWGGDRYAVHHRASDEALVLAWYTVWDTPADAEEFVDGYVAYAEERFGRQASADGNGRLCWAGSTDHLCLEWGPADTTIVLGPDEATVLSVLAAIRE